MALFAQGILFRLGFIWGTGHRSSSLPLTPQLADNVLGTIMDTPFFPEDVLQHVYLRAEPSGGGVSPSSGLWIRGTVFWGQNQLVGWTIAP